MTHPEGVTLGRRLAAISIDWIAAYAIAFAFLTGGGSYSERIVETRFLTPLVFVAEYAVLISLTGSSFGHRLMRLRVVDFNHGGSPKVGQVLIRTGLMALLITAITYDEDGRGIHERFSQTRLTRLS